jgi:acyl carrier protein
MAVDKLRPRKNWLRSARDVLETEIKLTCDLKFMSPTVDLPPKLIDYLNEARAPLPPFTDPDQPLQIDSLGLIRLVGFLENDLAIRVEDDELLADNFATARNLARLISAKMEKHSDGHLSDHTTLGWPE